MSLPAPDLDKRRFQDLMDEAMERIPRFTPDWTNFNDSDPGMTLVQLYAWLSETILYDLNRVPELNYVKFLNLLGITPRPAQPARAEISFTLEDLSKPGDALSVPVPLGTAISVDDPDLEEALTFETDRTLMALNAHIGAVVAPGSASGTERRLVTRYDEGAEWLHAFDPFGSDPARHDTLYIGLLLRPILDGDLSTYSEDALPAGPLDLHFDTVQVYDQIGSAETPEVLDGPLAWHCADDAGPGDPLIEWQVYTGGGTLSDFPADAQEEGWATVSLSRDDSNGLTRSGHVVLELPRGAVAVDPAQMAPAFWADMGASRPPRSQAELAAALRNEDIRDASKLDDFWVQMGHADDANLTALQACASSAADVAEKLAPMDGSPSTVGPLDPSQMSLADWIEVDENYDLELPQAEDNFRKLYWLRARIRRAPEDTDLLPLMLQALRLNTVPATQAATVREERLGVANGRPAQQVSLRRTPVLIDPDTNTPDLSLTLAGADNLPLEWQRVDDFYRSGPDDAHYMLDPISGQISFGDGRRGQMPVAGSRITAARYRVGGGEIGNVGEGKISKLKGRVRGVKQATNHRPAHDGANAESVDAAKRRAPHDLRSRDRAVSAEDFRDLALQTPGVNLHKVFALPRKAVDDAQTLYDKEGAVTLLVLPKNDEAAPQPSQDQQRAICRWLEPRRLITTELHVIGPRYSQVTTLAANIIVDDGYDLSAVTEALYARLMGFMHPLSGGVDGQGWPFGGDIYHGDLYDQMLGVAGVRRVIGLRVALNGASPSTYLDYNTLAEGHLPVLSRDAIDLVASYA